MSPGAKRSEVERVSTA